MEKITETYSKIKRIYLYRLYPTILSIPLQSNLKIGSNVRSNSWPKFLNQVYQIRWFLTTIRVALFYALIYWHVKEVIYLVDGGWTILLQIEHSFAGDRAIDDCFISKPKKDTKAYCYCAYSRENVHNIGCARAKWAGRKWRIIVLTSRWSFPIGSDGLDDLDQARHWSAMRWCTQIACRTSHCVVARDIRVDGHSAKRSRERAIH